MKTPISILESKLPEYNDRLRVYRSLKQSLKNQNKKQQKYFDGFIRGCESEIESIVYAIGILLNHSKLWS